jgi:hypothetical protein
LARDEDMPRLEALGASSLPFWDWRQRLTRPRRNRRSASSAGAAYAPGTRLRAILLVPITLAALAPAVFLGLGGRSVSGCGPAARPQYTGPALSRPRSCLSVPPRVAYQRLQGMTPAPTGRSARGGMPWAGHAMGSNAAR